MASMIPPGHGEPAGPGPMPRCPHCTTVIDTQLAAGTGGGQGRCPTHGLVTAVYGRREEIRAGFRHTHPVIGTYKREVSG